MASVISRRLTSRCFLILRRSQTIATANKSSLVPHSNYPRPNWVSSCTYSALTRQQTPAATTYTVLRFTSDDRKLENVEEKKKPNIFQRFKQMYKDYWYVLLPVHLVTSAAWFGGFYYLAKSGMDIVGILEYWNVSEKIINPLKDSSMGYIAVSYACYKIATPIRYTITLGGTTLSINYLKQLGYLKPVPSTQQLKDMYKESKENIIESMKDKKHELQMKKEQFKDKTDHIMEEVEKSIKDKIKDSRETFRENKENMYNFGKIKLKTKT